MKDSFGRIHNYLRLSLTDACNFRCSYCMPDEDIQCSPHEALMQTDEILRLAKTFIKLGVNKIRLTGGEPLVRKEAPEIIRQLSALDTELTITTNAFLLNKHFDLLQEVGMRSLNISLDSLDPNKFFMLSKRDAFKKVWANIMLLLENEFSVKINVVLMKGINDDEILDFIKLTKELPLHIRFIEFMPFDQNQWKQERLVSFEHIIHEASNAFDIIKLPDAPHATTKKFKAIGHEGTFAVISTMTNPFCDSCNRIRLTADGKMKNCLFSKGETDLLTALRNGEDIEPLIRSSIFDKKKAWGGQLKEDMQTEQTAAVDNRSMIRIGG